VVPFVPVKVTGQTVNGESGVIVVGPTVVEF
jgi:hypothetical protein